MSRRQRPVEVASRGLSAWHLLGLGVIALGLAVSSYATIDPDIYWHRILGQLWLDQRDFDLTPDPIAYTAAFRTWFPTAWLPEVGYALLVDAFGYAGILGLRFVLATMFYLLLLRYLAAHCPAWLAALMLVVVGLPAALVLQDRPQTGSLVLCAALLPSLGRWYLEDATPRTRNAVILTWVWANLHGLWVLVPCFLLLAALSDLVTRNPRWRHLASGAVLCLAVAAVTPVGPRLLLSPFLVSASAGQLREWQPTALGSPVAWGLAVTLLILLIGFARSPLVPVRQLLAAGVIVLFGFLAYRNAVVASVLLLPLSAALLTRQLHFVRTTLTVPRAVILAVGGLALLWTAQVYAGQPAVPEHSPARIAEALRAYPSVRVLAPYNDSGYLREFGGDGVRLAIDGRADRYGDERIRNHLALMDAQGRWRRQFAALDPDVVVVDRRSPLRELLIQDGWGVAVRDRDLVLLTMS